MGEKLSLRVKRLGNWSFKDQESELESRLHFITQKSQIYSQFFKDPENHRAWDLDINLKEANAMASMIGAFEFGIRQVYRKVGYTDDEIDNLENYRIAIGSLSGQRNPPFLQVFAYDYTSSGTGKFVVDVHGLLTAARIALDNNGIAISHSELKDQNLRRLHVTEACLLSGVEEAAHSLFVTHKINRIPINNDGTQSVFDIAHADLPHERAALKWKRNYALRFMPDFAQGFVDFENGLADK